MITMSQRLHLTIILRKFSYEEIDYNITKACFKMVGFNIDELEFNDASKWPLKLKQDILVRRNNPKYEDIKYYLISDKNNNKYKFANDIENIKILANNDEEVSKRILDEYTKIKSMKK